jgi:hypothetical protein
VVIIQRFLLSVVTGVHARCVREVRQRSADFVGADGWKHHEFSPRFVVRSSLRRGLTLSNIGGDLLELLRAERFVHRCRAAYVLVAHLKCHCFLVHI